MSEKDAFQKWLDGKRTYLTAIAIAIVGILQGLEVPIPPWVWPCLSAAGLGFLRAGVAKALKDTGKP